MRVFDSGRASNADSHSLRLILFASRPVSKGDRSKLVPLLPSPYNLAICPSKKGRDKINQLNEVKLSEGPRPYTANARPRGTSGL